MSDAGRDYCNLGSCLEARVGTCKYTLDPIWLFSPILLLLNINLNYWIIVGRYLSRTISMRRFFLPLPRNLIISTRSGYHALNRDREPNGN
jgi:hypothetical protein